MDSGNKFERPRHPRANANIFEVITFSWLLNLFKIGWKRDLGVNDLYTTLHDHTSSSLGDKLEKRWKSEINNAREVNRKPSLLRVLVRMFGAKMMFYGFLLAVGEIVLKMVQPQFIGGLLAYFSPDESIKIDLEHAYIYASGLMISMFASMILYHLALTEMLHFGMKMRVACCSLVFRKALRLSKTAFGETTVGQMVNLLSNDVNRFDMALLFLHYLWISPVQTIVALYFLWREIGISSVSGIAVLIVFTPLYGWFGKKTSEFRSKIAVKTDERVRLMNEIISGIQLIKMYAWEKPFAYLVQCARRMEIQQIRGTSYIRAALVSIMALHTKLALFVSILSYVLLGNNVTAQKVFILTAYYTHLRSTMTIFFPRGLGLIAELLITIRRLQEKACQYSYPSKIQIIVTDGNDNPGFELDDSGSNKTNGHHIDTRRPNGTGIVVSNATAKWTDDQTEISLDNINLTVKPGRMVAVIGPVGAGKSSLIQAILQELPLSEGNISVNGVVSYASQEPWLFAGSVRNNILFGLPMDEQRYEDVISVCALEKDFQQLPYGDRTIVGERGISLSGGQRARINLARAVYKQADIYLLDDPLSAVDAHVGRHLYEKCIKGYLKEKTCVLVTHQVQYLTDVDRIVLMDNAAIFMEGTYDELRVSNLSFTSMFPSSDIETVDDSKKEFDTIDDEKTDNYDRRSDSNGSEPHVDPFTDDKKDGETPAAPAEIAETRFSGNVSKTIYWLYISAGGTNCKILFFIVTCVFTQILVSGGDLWISYWVNLEEHVFSNSKIVSKRVDESLTIVPWWSISRQICVTIFAVITFLMVVATVFRSLIFVSMCMKASMTLHNAMFKAITRATMYFFDTNSSGRILNRFSKDIGSIDESVPVAMMDCVHYGFTLLGIVVVVGYINVYLLLPTFFLAYVFYKINVFYLSTSRSIKRLEGTTRSPVFTHLNSTLQGLTTIRAFEAEQILSLEFDKHQDLHSSTCYLSIASSRALGLWIDFVLLTYLSVVTFHFIVFDNNIFGGNVGLAITQAFGLAGSFQWGMRQVSELENNMTSVERVVEYTNIPQEAALESPLGKKPPKEWPTNGKITLKNFYLRYGPDSPYVLKNFNINIEPMQKVGIVGRTGAGKSSLIKALFRLAYKEGYVVIDDVEIHEMGLHELRSKISIIPQEPFLFVGTLRKNLDPFNGYPDHILWDALDDVKLKEVVEDLPDGLNSKMSEGGSNFSVGQRQLVCLARAIVRNNKILVLDEATANIDTQTDSLIQNTIRNKFQHCTVLTIAHRLNTVMDSDVVIVMDGGLAVEFDHPFNLLKNVDGFFYKMVEDTGRSTADVLHGLAVESYKSLKAKTKHDEIQ